MNTLKLSNVSLADYRLFLQRVGCTSVIVSGGHEKWVKNGLMRPIIVQTHVDPVPEFIIKNALRVLNLSKFDFFKILGSK